MSYVRLAPLFLLCIGCSSQPEPEPEPEPGRLFPSPLECGTQRGLPPNVETLADHFLIHCGARALDLSLLESGVARLHRLEIAASSTPRESYAVVAQPDPSRAVSVGRNGSSLVVCTSELTVTVFADCSVTATDAQGRALYQDSQWTARSIAYRASPTDHFYGLGERTGPLDRRGTQTTLWNTDAYVAALGGYPIDADPLYQSIPLLITLRDAIASAVFTDNSHRLRYDVAATHSSLVRVTADGGDLDQYLVAGPSLAEVTRRYTWLTGRLPLPPRWALGYHQSRWGYATDTRVREVAAEFRKRNIPADALWLDIQHMNGFRSFTWDPSGFADPASLMRDLELDGFKTVVIADPGIKVDPGWDVYDSGLAGNHFIRGSDGKPFVGEVWPGPSVFPDFTSSQTRAWWSALVARDSKLGARGLWIDMNEPASFTTPVPTAPDAHNVYALLEARATYDGMRVEKPDRRPMILSRAAFAGQQRYAAVWTGDAPSRFDTLRGTLPMLLGLGLSGLTFSGSDVGGYSGNATPELFTRWIQLGSISPFFRGHVTTNVPDQEPWAFGPEVEDLSRTAITRRYELLPYLYSLFHEATQTGAPILRPLVYEFQSDAKTHTLDDQAMLGSSLMFAPVLDPSRTTRSVYFPAGRWYEITSGAIIEGPATVDIPVTLGALPGWARAGAIIPRYPSMPHTDHHAPESLSLDIYPTTTQTSFSLYEDSGDGSGAHSEITYTFDGKTFTASKRQGTDHPAPRALTLRFNRFDHGPKSVTVSDPTLAHWSHDTNDRSLVITMPDRDAFTITLDYDPTVTELAPMVTIPIEVELPAGTATPISIATSLSGWTHQPFTGTLTAPRGTWLAYKFTRGSWSTVEKSATCGEIPNRALQATARPTRRDKIARWVDDCP